MSQQFYHHFYIILGIDKMNGTKLIKIGNAKDFKTRLSQYSTQYPMFIPLTTFPIQKILSRAEQIETIEKRMKDVCKNRNMQRYDMNHNGWLNNEFFVLNKIRIDNILTIVELLYMFYTKIDINTLQSQAESLYNKAFDY